MDSFSTRFGGKEDIAPIINDISPETRNRIWNLPVSALGIITLLIITFIF